MPNEGVEITGITEALTKLKTLDGKVQKGVVRRSLRKGAKIFQKAAQSAAPVASGLTKSAIKIRAGKAKKGTYRLNVGVGASDYQGETFYAAFVLYGHKVGSRKLGDARTLVPANNWLLKAKEKSEQQVAGTVVDQLLHEVEEATRE
jgi:HK97 gp10 family phage protein